jgi:hypothetical protein
MTKTKRLPPEIEREIKRYASKGIFESDPVSKVWCTITRETLRGLIRRAMELAREEKGKL